MPASSILLLETDPAGRRDHPHGLAARRLRRDDRPRRRPPPCAPPPSTQPRHRRRRRARAHRARRLPRAPRRARAWPRIPVLCISQTDDVEERIRFLEAGADDVIARPFDARELEARVEALLLRFQRSRDLTPAYRRRLTTAPRPKVVAVFSPKGGVGTTTIAVNIAILADQLHPERTMIVDLDLQFGARSRRTST